MSIRLASMMIYEIALPMRVSFSHALATRNVARNLLVCVTTASGAVGWGEAIPRDYLTGETLDAAWDDLQHRWWPAARELSYGDDALCVLRPLYLEADQARRTAGYAALDLAILHAVAAAQNRPVGSLLTGTDDSQKLDQDRAAHHRWALTAPLGGKSVKRVTRLAWVFRKLGFRHFKVKVGLGDDYAKLEAVRRVIGPRGDLRIDANAAWTPDEAIAFARQIAPLTISAFEQPIPAGNVADLRRVQAEGGIPVIADESICTLADAQALCEASAAQYWNLRLAKIGGYSGMLAVAALARAHDVGIHLGVLVGQTSLLAAAERVCMPIVCPRYMEYGFPRILLKGDPVRGGPGGYFGQAARSKDASGVGVRVLARKLARATVRCINCR